MRGLGSGSVEVNGGEVKDELSRDEIRLGDGEGELSRSISIPANSNASMCCACRILHFEMWFKTRECLL